MEKEVAIKVSGNGRMVLPMSLRKELHLSGESVVLARLEGSEIKLRPLLERIKEIQAFVASRTMGGGSVDDFLRDRREEAAREDERFSEKS